MKVYLAGYNVDADVLEDVKNHPDFKNREDFTPETLSASYARISRDPRPINELRVDARQEVEKTRKSNDVIIFGLGHSSVAEHAVFNLDLIGISRYLSEFVEKFRLVAYTEKSQRYITINQDYMVPEEFGTQLKEEYLELVKESFDAYEKMLPIFEKEIAKNYSKEELETKKVQILIESLAKENARYLLTLGTNSQLGMTTNARNLEHIISYLASLDLKEANDLASMIYEKINGMAPSVIKYYQPRDNEKKMNSELLEFLNKNFEVSTKRRHADVSLIDYKRDCEDRLFAYILCHYKNIDLKQALTEVKSECTYDNKKEILSLIFNNIASYDQLPRFFELIEFTFDLYVSSACYGQLKRHRMATNLPMDYCVSYGCTMPEIFKKTSQEKVFKAITKKASELFEANKSCGLSANYLLTNAHKRRVVFKTNLREMYHIAKLRLDPHAQWDILETSQKMVNEIAKCSPLLAEILKGKHQFEDIKEFLSK